MLRLIFNLLIPPRCLNCDLILATGEAFFCTTCYTEQPYVDPQIAELHIKNLLINQISFEHATALWHYQVQNKERNLAKTAINAIKYKADKKLCYTLGLWLGHHFLNVLKNQNTIDFIIPVPLHPKKEKKRKYNQATILAEALSEITGKPILVDGLKRLYPTDSQTKKKSFTKIASDGRCFFDG